MPPVPLPLSLPSLQQATEFLDAILAALYSYRDGGPTLMRQPIITEPILARQILARPDIFVKNYAFLEDLGRGRFSSNGDEWRMRAALTQSCYRNAPKNIPTEFIKAIYHRHLTSTTPLSAAELFNRFTLAAVDVFSHALNLPTMLPWPREIITRVRAMLKLRQWIAWNGCSHSDMLRVQEELSQLHVQISMLWKKFPELEEILGSFRAGALKINGFDANQELLQNVLASSEATASGLLWAAEALSQEPDLQNHLSKDASLLEAFIGEVLRMFPPVPCLTRVCTATYTTADGTVWKAGSVLTISIVGIHRNPQFWQHPDRFDISRPEFKSGVKPFAYMPFARGERVCAGMRLAQVELRAAVEVLLSLYDCRPGPTPTQFRYGLSSAPYTSLCAVQR